MNKTRPISLRALPLMLFLSGCATHAVAQHAVAAGGAVTPSLCFTVGEPAVGPTFGLWAVNATLATGTPAVFEDSKVKVATLLKGGLVEICLPDEAVSTGEAAYSIHTFGGQLLTRQPITEPRTTLSSLPHAKGAPLILTVTSGKKVLATIKLINNK